MARGYEWKDQPIGLMRDLPILELKEIDTERVAITSPFINKSLFRSELNNRSGYFGSASSADNRNIAVESVALDDEITFDHLFSALLGGNHFLSAKTGKYNPNASSPMPINNNDTYSTADAAFGRPLSFIINLLPPNPKLLFPSIDADLTGLYIDSGLSDDSNTTDIAKFITHCSRLSPTILGLLDRGFSFNIVDYDGALNRFTVPNPDSNQNQTQTSEPHRVASVNLIAGLYNALYDIHDSLRKLRRYGHQYGINAWSDIDKYIPVINYTYGLEFSAMQSGSSFGDPKYFFKLSDAATRKDVQYYLNRAVNNRTSFGISGVSANSWDTRLFYNIAPVYNGKFGSTLDSNGLVIGNFAANPTTVGTPGGFIYHANDTDATIVDFRSRYAMLLDNATQVYDTELPAFRRMTDGEVLVEGILAFSGRLTAFLGERGQDSSIYNSGAVDISLGERVAGAPTLREYNRIVVNDTQKIKGTDAKIYDRDQSIPYELFTTLDNTERKRTKFMRDTELDRRKPEVKSIYMYTTQDSITEDLRTSDLSVSSTPTLINISQMPEHLKTPVSTTSIDITSDNILVLEIILRRQLRTGLNLGNELRREELITNVASVANSLVKSSRTISTAGSGPYATTGFNLLNIQPLYIYSRSTLPTSTPADPPSKAGVDDDWVRIIYLIPNNTAWDGAGANINATPISNYLTTVGDKIYFNVANVIDQFGLNLADNISFGISRL